MITAYDILNSFRWSCGILLNCVVHIILHKCIFRQYLLLCVRMINKTTFLWFKNKKKSHRQTHFKQTSFFLSKCKHKCKSPATRTGRPDSFQKPAQHSHTERHSLIFHFWYNTPDLSTQHYVQSTKIMFHSLMNGYKDKMMMIIVSDVDLMKCTLVLLFFQIKPLCDSRD